MFFASSSLKGH